MLDIKFIRENIESVEKGLSAKKTVIDLPRILEMDRERRSLLTEIDQLREKKNAASIEIGALLKEKKDASDKIAAMKEIGSRISNIEPRIRELETGLHECLLAVPNLPHESVPVGSVENNQTVRTWGEAVKPNFPPKTHIELAEDLDIIDFKRATKLSGSNFVLYKKEGARLERALFNFMLDLHTREHGFEEVFPPFVVNTATMTGTGQLPKMKDDMYHMQEDDLYLIPTAEVPITNIFRDEILNGEDLPVYYAGYTACFRREAGSYGKDTRGLMRVHQFNKVEMVKFVHPDSSYEELESLVGFAEKVLQLLGLPYRVVILASEDLSFAASKCYDLEAYSCGVDKWLEVSSCSNFEDFQARRMGIRFRGKETKKPAFVHTLNGSGLALARTMIAILENGQTAEGEVVIPEVLRPYMGGLEKIRRK